MQSMCSGVDDINEFESELEAPEKWARRFRMMKEAEGASSADESTPEIKADADEHSDGSKDASSEEGEDGSQGKSDSQVDGDGPSKK